MTATPESLPELANGIHKEDKTPVSYGFAMKGPNAGVGDQGKQRTVPETQNVVANTVPQDPQKLKSCLARGVWKVGSAKAGLWVLCQRRRTDVWISDRGQLRIVEAETRSEPV